MNPYSAVIDPSAAQAINVECLVVEWGDEPTDKWRGVVRGALQAHPQVELRRQLQDGTDVVVRLSLGNQITYRGGTVLGGLMITMNGPFVLNWQEYYNMLAAVQEGVDRLVVEQGVVLENVGDVLVAGRINPA